MTNNLAKTASIIFFSFSLIVLGVVGTYFVSQAQAQAPTGSSFVSGDTGGSEGSSVGNSPAFQVNIPAIFTDTATLLSMIVEEDSVFNGQARFLGEVILENDLTLVGNLVADGAEINVGNGTITASNLVYSVVAGSGISVSGDQDITITNDDRGSAQKIFSKMKVGSDTAEAGSNTDTFEFSAGDGIGLSLNTSDKKLTLTASNLSGWYKASSSNVALITSTNNVGIGTTSPSNKLEIDSGTNGETGITFTRVTSSTAAGVGGGKVLSVDSGGKLILVEDQTGGGGAATPSAEAVLPSATSGMTLYFNGTNWVSSNNLYHDGGSVGISTTNPLSRFQVNSNLASKIGAIFRGYTSQTANLTEWQDVNGNVLSYIDANGVFNGTANVSGSLNPGLTNGSVLFQGASGITQDNANFFWDDTNNRLGIGTTVPAYKVDVTGNLRATTSITSGGGVYNSGIYYIGGVNYSAMTLSGSALSLGYENTSLVLRTSSATQMLINASGLVGIGTTSPTALLHVNGGYGTNDAFTVNQTLSGNILSASASGATKLVLTNAGRVGIGTSTPGSTLHVQGTASNSYLTLSTSTGNLSYIGPSSDAFITGATEGQLGIRDSDAILFAIGLNEVMRISSTSNVGIGTTTPGTKLEVVGLSDGRWAQFKNVDGVSGINFRPGASSGTTYSNIQAFSGLGAANLILNEFGGSVGIGTTIPSEKLHVYGDVQLSMTSSNEGGSIFMGNATDGVDGPSIVWGTTLTSATNTAVGLYGSSGNNSTGLFFPHRDVVAFSGRGVEVMRISNIGDVKTVGIGTTSPTALLHVNGGYGANDALTINQTLGGNILSASASGTTKFVISNSGNVGIGTSSPGGVLEVRASNDTEATTGILLRNSNLTNISPALEFGNSNVSIYRGASHNLVFNHYGDALFTSSNNGKVGIGTLTPTSKFQLTGSYGGNALMAINESGSNTIFTASSSGITRLALTNGGSLQIYGQQGLRLADSDSSNYMAIRSAATLDGDYTLTLPANDGDSGQVLSTDGSGGLSWASPLSLTDIGGVPTASISGSVAGNALSLNGDGTIATTLNRSLFLNPIGGNVGIGTTSAPSKLTIRHDATYSSPNMGTSAYGALHIVPVNSTNGNMMGISFGMPATNNLRTDPQAGIYVQGSDDYNGSTAGTRMHFATTNNGFAGPKIRMTLNELGYLGIGTTNAGAQLQTGDGGDGHARMSGGSLDIRYDFISRVYLSQNLGSEASFGYGSGGIRVSGQGIGEYGYILGGRTAAGGSGYDLLFNPSTTGSVGIGTFVPGSRLTVAGFGNTTGGTLNITDVNGVSGLYMQDRGTIGMGTTAPTARLHINGGYGSNDAFTINQTLSGNIMSASASGTTKMVLTNTGRLGINNSLAYYMVDITSTADGTDNGGALAIKGASYNTHGGYMILNKNTGDDTPGLIQVGDNSINLPLLLNPNGGNVAIGTTTASYKLDVNGEIRTNNIVRVTGNDGGFYATPRWGGTYNFLWYNQDGNAMRLYSNQDVFSISYNGNVGVGTNTYGDTAANAIAIYNSTAPTTSIANGVQLFAVDVTGSHELQVRDEAGNVTTLSPHNFSQIEEGKSEDLAWSFYSERNGLAINADMTKALRVIEKLSGEKLVYIKNLTNGADLSDFYSDQANAELQEFSAQWITRSELSPFINFTNDTWTFLTNTIFTKPVEFLAEVTFKSRINRADQDAAGIVLMKAGDTVAHVQFEKEFNSQPAVTVTPQDTFATAKVSELTTKGFTLTLSAPQSQDIQIIWTTVLASNLKVTESERVEIAPTPTLAPALPTPQPSPIPSDPNLGEIAGESTPATDAASATF